MSEVAVIKCDDYQYKRVQKAVRAALNLLGGIKKFVKEEDQVLLKPNLLAPRSPEEGVTTHPAVVKAVAEEVLAAGAKPIISDTPGFVHLGSAFLKKVGVKEIAEELKIPCIPLESKGFVRVKLQRNAHMRSVYLAKLTKEVDVVINLPKLKTHTQAYFTGAVKNMFGAIPRQERKRAHTASSYKMFSSFLVDLFSVVNPQINIMDGIIGMEGNGPSAGELKKLGVLIASEDAIALDTVSSYLMGFDPLSVETNKIGGNWGIGENNLRKIKILGEKDLDKIKVLFKKPPIFTRHLFNLPISGFFTGFAKVKPYIPEDKCKKCKICSEVCPVGAIQYEVPPFINPRKCIECFCCHEMCPHKVIEIRKNFIARLVAKMEGGE